MLVSVGVRFFGVEQGGMIRCYTKFTHYFLLFNSFSLFSLFRSFTFKFLGKCSKLPHKYSAGSFRSGTYSLQLQLDPRGRYLINDIVYAVDLLALHLVAVHRLNLNLIAATMASKYRRVQFVPVDRHYFAMYVMNRAPMQCELHSV